MKADLPILVILTPGFPADEQDMNCLPAHQQFVLTFNRLFPHIPLYILSFQYPFTPGTYHWHGNKVTAFGGRNRGGLARRMLWYQVRKKLDHLAGNHNITVILNFWAGETARTGMRWAAKKNIPALTWLMGQDARAGNKHVAAYRPAPEQLIAVSDFTAEEFRKNYGIKPAHIIPMGTSPVLPVKDPPARDIDLLCAGSLISLKNYSQGLDTAQTLIKHFPGLKMFICGDGPERKRLEKQAAESGLRAHLRFTGELPHAELLELMKRSKIFLHPSRYEGFSVACQEALAAGMQVVSFHRPMQGHIPNWHIAGSPEAFSRLSAELLIHQNTYIPYCYMSVEETVRRFTASAGPEAFINSFQVSCNSLR